MSPRAGALPVPAWSVAVTAMLSVQLSSALAVGLIDAVGPAGTAWLRLSMGAVIFVAIARPPLRSLRRPEVPWILVLGVATGLMTVFFLAAIERIPLGTAVAVEFLGPLAVAAWRAHARSALAWPALAVVGVVLMTRPWTGEINTAGLAFAGLAGVGWATYILLTQRIGDRYAGTTGLSLTIPVAALTAAVAGIPQAHGHLSGQVLLTALGLALLMPVLPFVCEMVALRHMTPTAFGTLMALEPAFGVLLGAMVLHQTPAAFQLVGIALVVAAGAGAQRVGRRTPTDEPVVGSPPIAIGKEPTELVTRTTS
ncbi:EamA family transporter [Nocardioides cavernaquae]|nr:EamA family transporter [Nocardioides cavernaquae]